MTPLKRFNLLTEDLGASPKWVFAGLLVALVVGILYINGFLRTHSPQTRIQKTRDSITAVAKAMETFFANTGHYPEITPSGTPADLDLRLDQMIDGWGQALHIAERDKFIRIGSAGPDGRLGTKDDLTN